MQVKAKKEWRGGERLNTTKGSPPPPGTEKKKHQRPKKGIGHGPKSPPQKWLQRCGKKKPKRKSGGGKNTKSPKIQEKNFCLHNTF